MKKRERTEKKRISTMVKSLSLRKYLSRDNKNLKRYLGQECGRKFRSYNKAVDYYYRVAERRKLEFLGEI